MAAGEARLLHAQRKLPVLIVGIDGRPRWSEVYEGNPYLLRWGQRACKHVRMINGPHARPYIASKTDKQWTWRPYQPKPAEVFLTDEEKAFAEPYRGMVMVEPNGKNIGHSNKLWLWERWVALLEGSTLQFVQCISGLGGQNVLHKAQRVTTPTFRHAMAVLSVCRLFVGGEGGLHHAAAAVGVPAVVLFGGFISPEVTGYQQHENLFTGLGLGCGARVDCVHCRSAMQRISVEDVNAKINALLRG
jgi:ADP-heptose:LPS heptosyltransferase